jgi:hypothetical protein
MHAPRRLFAVWRLTLQFSKVIGKRGMPPVNGSTEILSRDAEQETLEISCEPTVGVDAHQVILQLACALARLAAREDDALENDGPIVKRE